MGHHGETGGPAGVPTVSVLLPVYNAASFLDACLTSLRRQTLRRFEVVAVDDGSSDGSSELLGRWVRRDPRVRLVRQPHRGLVEALNAGLDACRAPLVARMDADDLAHPRRLELQYRALRARPELDIVSCLVSHFPRRRVGGGFRVYERWLNSLRTHEAIFRERFIESPLPHPSVMVRRALLQEVGGYRDRGWPEDYDLWLRLAERGARFGKLPRRLLFWRQHTGRLTHRDQRYRVERFLQCKAYHLASGPLRNSHGAVLWGAGKTGRRLSKHLLRFGVELKAVVDIDPRKVGRTLRGIPVVAPSRLPGLLKSAPATVVLACVASRGAREIIRRRLTTMGLREGEQFWCVA